MPEKDFKVLFAQNLSALLRQQDKKQQDLAKFMGVSSATVSNWCTASKCPRMAKVDLICEFFNVQRSDLLEEKKQYTKEEEEIKALLHQRPNLLPVYKKLFMLSEEQLKKAEEQIDLLLLQQHFMNR